MEAPRSAVCRTMRYQHEHDLAGLHDDSLPSAAAVSTLISAGQAGAERAVLEWATENQVEHAGWCPQGRRAEDGVIPTFYKLRETRTRNYAEAIDQNVRDSDATLIITLSRKLTGALKNTIDTAKRARKPLLHISKSVPLVENARRLRDFLADEQIVRLHVTGSRASDEPEIEEFVSALFTELASLE